MDAPDHAAAGPAVIGLGHLEERAAGGPQERCLLKRRDEEAAIVRSRLRRDFQGAFDGELAYPHHALAQEWCSAVSLSIAGTMSFGLGIPRVSTRSRSAFSRKLWSFSTVR